MSKTEAAKSSRPSFDVSLEAVELIDKIVDRAEVLAGSFGGDFDRMTTRMDLTACHANGCRLKLSELLMTDDFNFAHDVFGIRNHINRRTGQLEGCFLPRFAQPEAK